MIKTCLRLLYYSLIASTLFLSCLTIKSTESVPSFSNKNFTEWDRMDPQRFDSALNLLDNLITADAKNYFRSLDEIPAVVLLVKSFGTSIDWNLEELDGKKTKLDRMNAFDFAYYNRDLKATLICQGYYRHLRNQFFNLQLAKDSLISKYPQLNSRETLGLLNSTLLKTEQDSILNAFRFYQWEVNDTVSGIFEVEPGSVFLQYEWCNYQGKIVSKDAFRMKLGIMITSLDCLKNRRPKTGLGYSVGKTIYELPLSLSNLSKKSF